MLATQAERRAVTAQLHGVMLDIATSADEPATGRISAAIALDNRLNGLPVARTVSLTADASEAMDPDERRARIAELRRFIEGGGGDGVAASAAGGAQASDPD